MAFRRELKNTEAQTDKLLERIIESDSPAAAPAYEKKIVQLESRKLLLAEKIEQTCRPQQAYEDLFELAMRFLSSPWTIWNSGHFKLRRMVLRLAFVERLG